LNRLLGLLNFSGNLLRAAVQENTELEGLLKLMLKDSEVTSPLYEEKVQRF
jgi:hypothetical protein